MNSLTYNAIGVNICNGEGVGIANEMLCENKQVASGGFVNVMQQAPYQIPYQGNFCLFTSTFIYQ